jgi:hypothetical protein
MTASRTPSKPGTSMKGVRAMMRLATTNLVYSVEGFDWCEKHDGGGFATVLEGEIQHFQAIANEVIRRAREGRL